MARGNGQAYYASNISDNIAKTPEGFLVCRSVVIARTGWQLYTVGDLPQEAARELGVDLSDPDASINLYRSPEDVFAPATIASFLGKPVCDDHPPEFVNPENFQEFTCGHIQNVRRGPEALESGEWPLLADLFIQSEELIRKIESRSKRETSCGYDFSIERVGDKICQIAILGNHVAVVKKGRAGAEARINDAAPEAVDEPVVQNHHEAVPDRKQSAEERSSQTQKKETRTVKIMRDVLLGLGLKAFVADGERKPEEIAEAARAMAKDDELSTKVTAPMTQGAEHTGDSACMPGKDGHMKCTADKCMAGAKDAIVGDAKMTDKRARMHAALDKYMDENEAAEGEKSAATDREELMNMFGGEKEEAAMDTDKESEAEEEESEETDDDAEIIEPLDGEEEEEMAAATDAEAEAARAFDAALDRADKVVKLMEPAIIRTTDVRVKKAFDSAPLTDAKDFMSHMKPAIARTKDARVKRAHDQAAKFMRPTATGAEGNYARLARASGAARGNDSETKRKSHEDGLKTLQAAYDKTLATK